MKAEIFIQKRVFLQRAFTLVELLIVITIVGILSSVAILSYNGTQRIARDNQRKNDLQTVGTALITHHQDTRNWSVIQQEAQATTGKNLTSGWVNFEDATRTSMAQVLAKLNYLTSVPFDPTIAKNASGQYLAVICRHKTAAGTLDSTTFYGWVLFTRLESPGILVDGYSAQTASDIDDCWMNQTQTLKVYVNSSSHKSNYAILVK